MKFLGSENDVLELCTIQGEIFESCIDENKSEMDFLSKYMKSTYAQTFDNNEYWISSFDKINIINEISKICKNKPIKNLKREILHFAGYFYRYYCYLYQISSISAWKKISFQYLYNNYDVLHSFDIKKACEVAHDA